MRRRTGPDTAPRAHAVKKVGHQLRQKPEISLSVFDESANSLKKIKAFNVNASRQRVWN
jgi:hypothetical protein